MEKLLLSCQNPLIFRLILAVLLGGAGLNANADFDEGVVAYGKGDYATALRAWQPLAEQGDAAAQYNLGLMHETGQGVPQDDKAAAQWFRRAAEQGHASAQNSLGVMYDQGKGVPQDDKAAVQWYRRAAEQGHALAQSNLGVMYDQGKGVLQDDKAAVQWYRRAAEQGNAGAQYNLGLMYANGKGVPQNDQDDVYGHMWTNIAASGGEKNAVEFRNLVEKRMTRSQIAEAQKLARECVRKAYRDC